MELIRKIFGGIRSEPLGSSLPTVFCPAPAVLCVVVVGVGGHIPPCAVPSGAPLLHRSGPTASVSAALFLPEDLLPGSELNSTDFLSDSLQARFEMIIAGCYLNLYRNYSASFFRVRTKPVFQGDRSRIGKISVINFKISMGVRRFFSRLGSLLTNLILYSNISID